MRIPSYTAEGIIHPNILDISRQTLLLVCAMSFTTSHRCSAPATRNHVRWLQTDRKTGEFLIKTVDVSGVGDGALDAKISQQVRAAKLTELAAFREQTESRKSIKPPIAAIQNNSTR